MTISKRCKAKNMHRQKDTKWKIPAKVGQWSPCPWKKIKNRWYLFCKSLTKWQKTKKSDTEHQFQFLQWSSSSRSSPSSSLSSCCWSDWGGWSWSSTHRQCNWSRLLTKPWKGQPQDDHQCYHHLDGHPYCPSHLQRWVLVGLFASFSICDQYQS